jgi:tetratricopeptide (TPR) repeat protein
MPARAGEPNPAIASGGAGRGARALAAGALAVAAVVAIAYGPVLRAGALSLDDNEFVTANPLVTHPGWPSARRFFTEVLNPSSVKGYYLPVTMTSLMLDCAWGGRPGDLRAFHRTNLALHLAGVVLIVLILHRLLGALLPAAAMGLLFGLHPLGVEPVAWIAGRKTLLAAAFGFACVLGWVEHRRRGGRAWLITSLASYALALLSKPTVASLPLALLVLDLWPFRRFGRRAVVEKWPFLVLAALSTAVSIASQVRTSQVVEWPRMGAPEMLLEACYLPGFYLGKMIWPARLSCVYAPPEPWALSNPAVLAGAAGTLVLTLVLALAKRSTRAPLAGWLFFLVALAPTLGIIRWSRIIAYDNYVYFPALGVLLALGSGLAAAWRRPAARVAAAALVLAAAGAEAKGTRTALARWKDSTTLWRHIVAVAPGEPAAHNGLGTVLEARAEHDGAIAEFRRAIELGPGFVDAWTNLGEVLSKSGRNAEAFDALQRASELQTGDPTAAYRAGVAALRLGRLSEAAVQLRRALELKPGYTEARDRLGSVLVLSGRADEGVAMLRRSVAADSTSAHPHFGLAVVLLRLGGREREAAEHLRLAIRYQPDWAEPRNELAWLLATSADPALRDGEESLRLAARAVELTGRRDAGALDTEAAAEARLGRFDRAVETAREALRVAAAGEDDSLARAIGARLALYEQGRAFTEAPRPQAAPGAR